MGGSLKNILTLGRKVILIPLVFASQTDGDDTLHLCCDLCWTYPFLLSSCCDAKTTVSVNKINGAEAVRDTWSYPLVCPIFQLRIRRFQVQLLVRAPLKILALAW